MIAERYYNLRCWGQAVLKKELCCLQALFRPVSMCVPDLSLICEIMLMADGFQQSKVSWM